MLHLKFIECLPDLVGKYSLMLTIDTLKQQDRAVIAGDHLSYVYKFSINSA